MHLRACVKLKMAACSDSVKAKLQGNLADFSALIRKLLEGVSVSGYDVNPRLTNLIGSEQSSSNFSSIIEQLIERDREIQQLVETALEMRSRQIQLDRVEGQLEKRTRDVAELQARLQDSEKLLELAVYHGKQKLESISRAEEGAVTPEELIRYAHRISQASSTVSPTGWQPSDPRRPYPQDVEMRSGFLGGFSAPAPQSEQGKFGADLAPSSSSSEPPEKKIALEKSSTISLQGVKQKPSNKPTTDAGFRMTFDEQDAMSEDSSSSSDEGT